MDSDAGQHNDRVRASGLRVVGRAGRRLVSFAPRAVAAAWPPSGCGVHRLLRQLRRRPVRLPPAATTIALEVQYAIQCRVDANRTRTTPRSIKPLLDHLAADGAASLLDHPIEGWLARLPAAASTTSPRAFLGYAIDCLLDVRDGAGWDGEYQRDVWLLRRHCQLEPSNWPM